MLQELSDLDFDTYFDVTSSNQQQQQQQRNILYHDESANQQQQQNINSLSSLLNNNGNNSHRPYQYTQQQQNFNGLFDWDLNSPNSQSPMEISPISSPQSSSDGYTSHSLSPQMMSSPPLYNNTQHIKNEASKVLEGFFAKRSLCNVIHTVPGINIPATPITENPPTSNNLPSPPLEDHALSGAFSAIDQWCQIKEQNVIHPLQVNKHENEQHETRHWRKTSTRYEQLHQVQPSSKFPEPGKQFKKVAHNAIERRYRNNINDRIRELKNVVPALYKARINENGKVEDDNSSDDDQDDEIVEGVQVAKKLNKATILRKATEYIQFLKNNNETTEQENMILQKIIAQMPGGNDVLTRFLRQKKEFENSEQERLCRERREAQERERVERQRMLRERAAQRAALAQLLPKPERRPYRRRQSSNNKAVANKKKSSSSSFDDNGNGKMFMAAFMCITFFSTSPFASSNKQSHVTFDHNGTSNRSLHSFSTQSSLDLWTLLRYTLYTFGIIYICFIPIFLYWLRPRPVNRPNKCLDHQHYANEVPTAWRRLYTNLTSILNKGRSNDNSMLSVLVTMYDIFCYTLTLFLPRFLLVLNKKPVACPEELSKVGAWIRLNEVECLGGNPDISRLSMLHSCIGMLANLHKMKRDEKHIKYLEPNTMARVYATTATQLELCLPPSLSSLVLSYCWKLINNNLMKQKEQPLVLLSENWLKSDCHDQVLYILARRNGFTKDENACRNIFYSFVLPYITSPLDLILYWQQLNALESCYHSYLNGTRPSFSQKQLKQALAVSATTTAPGHMLQWWVRVGLTLESLSDATTDHHQTNLDALAEYTRTKVPQINQHPTSNLLRRHQKMIYHMLEALTALQKHNSNPDQVPMYLQMANNDRRASIECLRQIDSSNNFEQSLLVISTLVVHLCTLKALIRNQQQASNVAAKRLSAFGDEKSALKATQAFVYIAKLRDQVIEDLESPYSKHLSTKCRNHIQSYIYQADDTLSL